MGFQGRREDLRCKPLGLLIGLEQGKEESAKVSHRGLLATPTDTIAHWLPRASVPFHHKGPPYPWPEISRDGERLTCQPCPRN